MPHSEIDKIGLPSLGYRGGKEEASEAYMEHTLRKPTTKPTKVP
jgi:hypothetical protein